MTRGFYPPEGFPFFRIGKLEDDNRCIDLAERGCEISITMRQYSRINAVFNNWEYNPRLYSCKDCAGFAQDVAKTIGLNHGGGWVQLPMSLIDYLINHNRKVIEMANP
jgi:hypothetical protein